MRRIMQRANDSFTLQRDRREECLTEVGLRNMDVIGYNRLLLPVASTRPT